MWPTLKFAAVTVALLVSTVSAQTTRTALPPLALESLTGRDSFERYCASCHGADASGGGPAATALKTRPSDLTMLARHNGGSFPRQYVAAVLEGRERPFPAHGRSDMPVWGQVFRALESSDARARVRLANLVAYVESVQSAPEPAPQGAAPPTGAQLFRAYCGSCHGETARGTGPLSEQLRRAVPDLTAYTARNGGVFPQERLRQIIEGQGPAAHGDRTMPVWGEVFRRQGTAAEATARIDALVAFVRSIQQRGAE